MNYSETLNFLFNQLPVFQRIGKAAYKADLNNTIALDNYFECPHKNFKSIHIAGTNGKGSVSHMLASILQTAGYKVGLYTSPHLKDFRERIMINGKKIPEKNVVEFVNNNQEIIKKISPSFFEMTVAMTFNYFSENKIDIGIIEVGLGGRLDSTNIIYPELSVITNISYDHTEFLGNTIEKIAYEKAGIIKKNIPVIIGEKSGLTKQIFVNKAKNCGSSIYFAEDEYDAGYSVLTINNMQSFNVKKNGKLFYENIETDLLGLYQKQNIITTLKSVDILNKNGFHISTDDLYKGLKNVVKNTALKGRWQILGNNPFIICDTAHNVAGISIVLDQIKATAHNKLHFVFGVVNDKKIDKILSLLPKDAIYYFTKANIPRALDETKLEESAVKFGLMGKTYPIVIEAFYNAKKNADKNDIIFVGGSTFVVAEVL
ncbi:MAG: bifunctional folylpolyglutamate synthase/dihydrofolate synthase [Bacteroidales bacterium]|nr:bifunctional folylpolyglutamate synthase/dihydrofolate synthase [Bacteroidales bacterium]